MQQCVETSTRRPGVFGWVYKHKVILVPARVCRTSCAEGESSKPGYRTAGIRALKNDPCYRGYSRANGVPEQLIARNAYPMASTFLLP